MHQRRFKAIFPALTLLFVLNIVLQADGQALNPPYERAPIEQYLMADRNAEIALARSAAPKSISRFATVAVLGRRGYETASRGGNGFTCLVERAWMNAFDNREFWNPRVRGPICYNPPASRSILLYTLTRTKLVVAGLSKTQMMDRIDSLLAKGRLPAPESGAMSYMMSKQSDLGDSVGSWRPHLMFHLSKSARAKGGASWGADAPGSPVLMDSSHRVFPEPETIFMVPVATWSDGTAAPRT